MSRLVNRAGVAINYLFKYAACLFLAIVIFATFTQVFSRYVMNSSLAWTEELARYSFIWLNMLASSVALRAGSHAAVSILEKRLKGRALAIHQCVINAIIVVGALFLIVEGVKMMGVSGSKPSTVLRIPMQYVYMAIPVGGVGILLQAVFKALTSFDAATAQEVDA